MAQGDSITAARPAGVGRPTALVVSPSLAGHRVIYCRVLAGILAEAGYRVALAGATGGDRPDPLLEDLVARPGVELLDIGAALSGRSLPLPELGALAERTGADVTVLCEADDFLTRLAVEGRGARLRGRLVGLFVRATNEQYLRPPSRLGRAKARLSAGAADAEAMRALRDRAFEKGGLVDVALVLDERYALRHPATHRWLPDIYREFGAPSTAAAAETEHWRRRLHQFLDGAGGRPVVVYVGANQHRRGYDRLLRLALDENGLFLHCGRFDLDGEPSDGKVLTLRAALERRGTLFETRGPYLSAHTATAFLEAARCVVLPYRQHDGSSGVMLQALAARRPVLVPDRGLMAYRARTFAVGTTYRSGDAGDLRRRFRALLAEGPEPYMGRLASYTGCFSPAQVAAAVMAAVSGRGAGAQLPTVHHAKPHASGLRGGR